MFTEKNGLGEAAIKAEAQSNPEQESRGEKIYTFLRSIVENSSAASPEKRLLSLAAALVGLGQKKRAEQVLEEVTAWDAFFSGTQSSSRYRVCAQLFAQMGDLVKARKYIELGKISKGGSFGYLESTFEDNLKFTEKIAGLGLDEEIKETLVSSAEKIYTFETSMGGQNAELIMRSLLKNGWLDEAKVFLVKYEQKVDALAKQKDEDWNESPFVKQSLNLALFEKIIDPASPKSKHYLDLALSRMGEISPYFADAHPRPIAQKMKAFAELGYEEGIAWLGSLFKEAWPSKYAHMHLCAKYVELNQREKVEKYYQFGTKAYPSADYLNATEWKNEATVLAHLGDSQKIDAFLANFCQSAHAKRRGDRVWDSLGAIVSVLCQRGYSQKIELMIRNEFIKRYILAEDVVRDLIRALSKNGPPELIIELLNYLPPADRADALFDFENEDAATNFNQLAPFMEGVPTEITDQTITKYGLLSLEPQSWEKVINVVRQQTNEADQSSVERSVRLLLIGYASLYQVETLLTILPLLKEKMSLNLFDTYRALMLNPTVITVLQTEYGIDGLIELAKLGVISEAKHLFYIDLTTLLRIRKTAQNYSPESQELNQYNTFVGHVIKSKTAYISSVMLCAEKLYLDLTDIKTQQDILESLHKLGGITPVLFTEFRARKGEERVTFAADVRRLRKQFYQNKSLTAKELNLSDDSFKKLLAEYITLLYKPVGMAADTVEKFISDIINDSYDRDLTAELNAKLKFGGPNWNTEDECFILDIKVANEIYQWKDGKQLDPKTKALGSIFTQEVELVTTTKPATQDQLRASALISIVRQGATIQPIESVVKLSIGEVKPSVLAVILSFLPSESRAGLTEFQQATETGDATAIKRAASKVREIIGTKLDSTFTPGVIIYDQWSKEVSQWLNQVEPKLKDDLLRATNAQTVEEAVALLYRLTSQHLLPKVVELIEKEERKIQVKGQAEGSLRAKKLKFYISKNLPSFFAKASAGICTSEDVSLFTREDHFHINMIDGETDEVVGNVQGYFLEIKGKQYLMLRGINPTTNFVNPANALGIIEGVLEVGKQLVNTNGLAGLVLSESLGGWHAHSNRAEVGAHLLTKYLIKDKEVTLDTEFFISNTTKIKRVFTVYTNPNFKPKGEETKASPDVL
jgi:hypothetical protein